MIFYLYTGPQLRLGDRSDLREVRYGGIHAPTTIDADRQEEALKLHQSFLQASDSRYIFFLKFLFRPRYLSDQGEGLASLDNP
jgi:hypothetical protein